MRLLRILSLLALLTPSFYAQASRPAPDFILEQNTSGGFVPREIRGWERGILVNSTGEVLGYTRKNYNHPRVYKTIGRLSSELLKAVLKKIEGFSAKDKLEYPDSPSCMDAPSTSYKAGLGEKKVLFSMRSNCRDGYLNSSYSEARTFRIMLNGYSAQYSLLR